MMSPQDDQAAEDLLQVQKCLRGDVAALGELRTRFDEALRAILRARGASATEADDTLADLWGDCVGNHDDRPALLEKYSGKSPLQSWLAMVATNRWYDAKRRQSRDVQITDDESLESRQETVPRSAAGQAAAEDAIVDLLRDSLKAAFAACPARDMVLLRLVFLHGLSQREVASSLGWNESKLSRVFSRAMETIELQALDHVKKQDSWLDLSWQDFLDMCQTRQIGFL